MAAKQAWTILWTLGFILMLEVMITTANLSQLASMISCSTKNPWIKYTSYGCYCGPGGEGTPLDNVDRCCQTHDGCYNHVMTSNECKYSIEVYLDEYKYTGCNKCDPNQSKCHLDICECDSKIAKCLEGKPLNTRYIGYEKAKCSKEYRRYYEFTGKDYYKDDTEIDVD